jgi:hypothetical protein
VEQEPKPKSKNSILGGLAVLGIAFMKFKLFIFMMLKQGLSMFIMIGVYAMFFGPIYALIVVALILIHESGHYIFMKFFGLDPKLPVFIPFFGAFVAMEKLPPDQAVDAWVSLAGPLVGGVTSVILFFFGVQQGNGIMMAAGSTGCFFNLLQLIAAKPCPVKRCTGFVFARKQDLGFDLVAMVVPPSTKVSNFCSITSIDERWLFHGNGEQKDRYPR